MEAILLFVLFIFFLFDFKKTGYRLFRTRWFGKEPYWVDEFWDRPVEAYHKDKKWRKFIDGKAEQKRYENG